MKRLLKLLIVSVLSLGMAACNSADTSKVETKIEKKEVDVDLTKLSSTMVYSEVSNMVMDAPSYVGKTVRMSGKYSVFTNQDQSQYYAAVIVADATACCQQGIEFVLKGKQYPNDYPEVSDDITVVGQFQTYDEDGQMYFHLVDAELE